MTSVSSAPVSSAPGRVLVVCCPQTAASGQLAGVVEEFCPRVEVLRPGACAIGARGPARYFGGEEVLARKIIEAAARRGLACQVGVADGLFAAQLAAQAARPALEGGAAQEEGSARAVRTGQEAVAVVAPGATPAFLAPHPVSSLGSPELADLLPRLGIRTLGEFAALSAAEAANRFGVQGTYAHRLAHGLDPRPLVPRPPSADLSVSREFDPPAELAEPVVFAAKALAEQMHAGLAARGLACVRVQVQVNCTDGQQITRLWRHDGLLSALAVAERVRWQLAGWRVAQGEQAQPGKIPGEPAGVPGEAAEVPREPAGIAGESAGIPREPAGIAGEPAGIPREPAGIPGEPGGIVLLRLVPDQLVRNTGRQLGLWGDAVVSDRVARAALRVQAMLGHPRVVRPLLAGGRGPAEQVTLVPFGDAADPAFPADRPWPGHLPAPAPATVYPDPLPARVIDASGDTVKVTGRALVSAPPARLSADGEPWLAITSWAGPWPLTERWWQPEDARRRARFQLIAEDGSAWLAMVQGGQWLLEASYE